MKKGTLLLISTLALGTAIAPLAGCSSKKDQVDHKAPFTIKPVKSGSGANFVEIIYDEAALKTAQPGDIFTFKLKVTKPSATSNINVTSITFGDFQTFDYVDDENHEYKAPIIKGEILLKVEAEYVDNSVTIKTIVNGGGTDFTTVNVEGTTHEAGTDLTFTVETEQGVIIDTVFFNNKPVTPTSGRTYTETLKKGENIIRVETIFTPPVKPDFKGDYGLLVAAHNKNNFYSLSKVEGKNVYKTSEPIKVNSNSKVAFYKRLDNGKFDTISSLAKLNLDNSYGAITSETGEGAYKGVNLIVAGGAKYDFEFDLDNESKPITIKRTEIVNLPSTQSALSSLINGYGYTNTYNDRLDINHIDFRVTTYTAQGNFYKETSTYDRYTNASVSKGSITENKVSKDVLMYREAKDNVLYEVDKFPNYYGHEENSKDIASRYNIVPTLTPKTKYQILESETQDYISEQVRAISSVGAMLVTAYEGFSGVKDYSYVTSEAVEGGFKTSLDASRMVEDDAGAFTHALVTSGYLTFATDGALKNVDVQVKKYTAAQFDTEAVKPRPGVDGEIYTSVHATYNYGLDTLEQIPQNTYIDDNFIKTIDSITIKDEAIPAEGNHIYPETDIVFPTAVSGVDISMKTTPAKALDGHQYGVTASSDEKVISYNESKDRWVSRHMVSVPGLPNVKSTTLTVGHLYGHKYETTTTVTVHDSIKIKGIFINDPNNPLISYPYEDELMETKSNQVFLKLGAKYDIIIGASPAKASIVDLIVDKYEGTLVDEYSLGELRFITRTFNDNDDLVLHIDLTQGFESVPKHLEKPLTCDISFKSPHFASTTPLTKILLNVMPDVKKSDIIGTWKAVLKAGTGTFHSTLIFDQNTVTVDCPEMFQALKIHGPIKFEHAYVPGDPTAVWDFGYGSYGINTSFVKLDHPDGVVNLTFTKLYFNPFTQTIDAKLEYAIWTGGDAQTELIIGNLDGTVEKFTKQLA